MHCVHSDPRLYKVASEYLCEIFPQFFSQKIDRLIQKIKTSVFYNDVRFCSAIKTRCARVAI